MCGYILFSIAVSVFSGYRNGGYLTSGNYRVINTTIRLPIIPSCRAASQTGTTRQDVKTGVANGRDGPPFRASARLLRERPGPGRSPRTAGKARRCPRGHSRPTVHESKIETL